MKIIICLALGAVMGAFGMRYVDEPKFAKETNAHISQGVDAAAAAAHTALQSGTSALNEKVNGNK